MENGQVSCREQIQNREALNRVDFELREIARTFNEAAHQLERLLSLQQTSPATALAGIDVDRVLHLLGKRTEIERRLAELNKMQAGQVGGLKTRLTGPFRTPAKLP